MHSHPRRDALRQSLQSYAAIHDEWRTAPRRVVVIRDRERSGPMLPLGNLTARRVPRAGMDVTSEIMGDPPPGRSALDKKWWRT